MFCKILFVGFLAVYLVRPGEAIFGLDAIIESAAAALATSINTVTQVATDQGISYLTDLQSDMQSEMKGLKPQISIAINNIIASAMSTAGGSQAKLAACKTQYQTQLADFEAAALNTIIGACLNVNFTQAISLVKTVSSLANNLTDMVGNVKNIVAAACPAPASGDMLEGVANAVCTVTAIGVVFGDSALQYLGLSGLVNQATATVQSISATASAFPTCLQAQQQKLTTDAISVVTPIVQCTLAT